MRLIGVSLAVPDPWGATLQTYRVGLGDRAAAGIPTHITLLPPLAVDDALLPAISAHLGAVAAMGSVFELHLRGTGTFRPVSPVVFVNVVEGISQCELLASAVRQGPLAIEAAFPYHPHVTVAHHLPEAKLDQAFDDLAYFDACFEADHFSLYVHHDERGWVPTEDFRLDG